MCAPMCAPMWALDRGSLGPLDGAKKHAECGSQERDQRSRFVLFIAGAYGQTGGRPIRFGEAPRSDPTRAVFEALGSGTNGCTLGECLLRASAADRGDD